MFMRQIFYILMKFRPKREFDLKIQESTSEAKVIEDN